MPLNESKGNMYTFVTHTWNAIKGECPHNCTYCYMHRFSQKPVHLDEKEFKTQLNSDRWFTRQNNFIFVGSSCDMFADDIPYEWIKKTLDYCNSFYFNHYLFQTKNPIRLHSFLSFIPIRSSLCTTIETNRFYPEIMNHCPKPVERAKHLGDIKEFEKLVTIEPIMDFDLQEMINLIKYIEPKQVNIGADSGNNNLPEPPKQKLLNLIDALKEFTAIDQKRNLTRLLK